MIVVAGESRDGVHPHPGIPMLRSTFPLSYNVQGQLLQMSFYLLEREKRKRVKEERKRRRSHLIYKP